MALSTRPAAPAQRERSEAVGREIAEQDNRQRTFELESGLSLQLGVPVHDPSMYMCWVNDTNGKIEILLSEGFEYVKPEEIRLSRSERALPAGSPDGYVRRAVGGGNEEYAYLLKLPKAEWDERQKAIQHRVRQTEIHTMVQANSEVGDNHYKPKGETQVSEVLAKARVTDGSISV